MFLMIPFVPMSLIFIYVLDQENSSGWLCHLSKIKIAG